MTTNIRNIEMLSDSYVLDLVEDLYTALVKARKSFRVARMQRIYNQLRAEWANTPLPKNTKTVK